MRRLPHVGGGSTLSYETKNPELFSLSKKQVYDLHESNSWLQHVGLGMYHSGLEVGGVEYTFSEAGIGQHPPRQIAGDGVSYKTTEVGVVLRAAPSAPQHKDFVSVYDPCFFLSRGFFFFCLASMSRGGFRPMSPTTRGSARRASPGTRM